MANIQKLTYPYFTDGSTQLNAQNLNPIIFKMNEMIEAINSGVTPTPTQTVATPTILISGTTATISCSTSGATIYYTLNGNTPTTSSTQYSSPITLSGACTIKAIAVKSGMSNSSVASQSYTPSATVQPPTIYIRDLAIIMDAESGATIRYTTDGSEPTSSSTQYTNAFTNASNCTVKAKAFKNGASSSVASASFTAPQRTDQAYPQIVIEGNKATLLSNGVGTLKYALNDSADYVNYTEPITLTEAAKVKARTIVSSTNKQCALNYTGSESIVVSMRPENAIKGIVNKANSTSSQLQLTSNSTFNLTFYPITSGGSYVLDVVGCPQSGAFWAYADSMPSGDISETTTISGKIDSNLPTSSGTSDAQQFSISPAENHAYLVTTSGTNYLTSYSREIVKA